MKYQDSWKGRSVLSFGKNALQGHGKVIGAAPGDGVYVANEVHTYVCDPNYLIDDKSGWRLTRWYPGIGHRRGGRLRRDAWAVSDMGGNYLAERVVDGKLEQESLHSHCLACAKSDVITKRGGRVDTRGWHKQGICGMFLLSVARIVEEEENGGQEEDGA